MPIDAPLPPVTSPHELAAEDTVPERTSAGTQSAGITLSVLSAMAHAGGAHAAPEPGRQLGMPRAKVHRYLVSLERMGLVEQDPAFAHYRLGVQALQVELSTLSDVDFVREGSNLPLKLAEQLDESMFLSIRAAHGPVIIHQEDSGKPAAVNVRVGSVMPLLNLTTGQVCAAWVPEIRIVSLVDRELRGPGAGKAGLIDWLNCRVRWQVVRQEGVVRTGGTLVYGIDSVAVPMLNSQDKLAGAITALGLSSVSDSSLEGLAARLLREAGWTLSLRPGYHGQVLMASAAAPRRGRRLWTTPESAQGKAYVCVPGATTS